MRDRSGVWRDVEATGRPGEVVILVDAALQALSKGALEACTHEVTKADEPRLSLVYELRPAMDIGRAILEGDWPPDEEDCPLFMTAPPRGAYLKTQRSRASQRSSTRTKTTTGPRGSGAGRPSARRRWSWRCCELVDPAARASRRLYVFVVLSCSKI